MSKENFHLKKSSKLEKMEMREFQHCLGIPNKTLRNHHSLLIRIHSPTNCLLPLIPLLQCSCCLFLILSLLTNATHVILGPPPAFLLHLFWVEYYKYSIYSYILLELLLVFFWLSKTTINTWAGKKKPNGFLGTLLLDPSMC